MSDELRDRAARIAYEIEVENYGGYDWDTAKNDAGKEVWPFEFAPPLDELDMAYEIADKIIALVRADERKRIREALLSEEAVGPASAWFQYGSSLGEPDEDVRELMRIATAGIGITVEDD